MNDLNKRLDRIKEALDLSSVRGKINQIERDSQKPEFWQDHQSSARQMQELSELQKTVEEIEEVEENISNPQLTISQLDNILERLELKIFLAGKYDRNQAILSIHAGQGGTEAMDWTSMLLRMYLKYCQSQNWQTEIVQETPGEEAGLKSVTVEITGPYAYGYLKREHGTHRLVRKSPFNADNKRQTSFALVEVMPLIDTDLEIELDPNEVGIDTFRSSGPGGQHANKTESAVRAVHKPTGLTVNVSSSRSQLTNRKTALNLLRGKLYQLMEEQQVKKVKELKGKYKPATWGNQIRSYYLDPYQLVKDHRTEIEIPHTNNVLDGDLNKLIESEIKLKQVDK